MRPLEITAVVLIAVMMLGPLALAPAYGPYVEPGTAAEVNEVTTPLEEGSEAPAVVPAEPVVETPDNSDAPQ